MIGRREFITLLGGVAAAWPLAARAAADDAGHRVPPRRMPIGGPLAAFHQGLSEIGFNLGAIGVKRTGCEGVETSSQQRQSCCP